MNKYKKGDLNKFREFNPDLQSVVPKISILKRLMVNFVAN